MNGEDKSQEEEPSWRIENSPLISAVTNRIAAGYRRLSVSVSVLHLLRQEQFCHRGPFGLPVLDSHFLKDSGSAPSL